MDVLAIRQPWVRTERRRAPKIGSLRQEIANDLLAVGSGRLHGSNHRPDHFVQVVPKRPVEQTSLAPVGDIQAGSA